MATSHRWSRTVWCWRKAYCLRRAVKPSNPELRQRGGKGGARANRHAAVLHRCAGRGGKHPRRRVAIAGDGGFLFTVQDLATAVELGISLPIIVWNNDAFGQIALGMNERDIPELGVKPKNPDFQGLAKSFHAHTEKPTSLAALTEAIRRALKADGPTVIEVHEEADYLK